MFTYFHIIIRFELEALNIVTLLIFTSFVCLFVYFKTRKVALFYCVTGN